MSTKNFSPIGSAGLAAIGDIYTNVLYYNDNNNNELGEVPRQAGSVEEYDGTPGKCCRSSSFKKISYDKVRCSGAHKMLEYVHTVKF